ncbi:MAG: hypothetical protein FD130_1319, partial [Halothiobacillaceae bacterium]
PDAENGQLVYNGAGTTDPATGTRVMAKYHINSKNFEYGYITPNDHWDNYWRHGPNAALGWDQNLTGSGDGAKTLGQELANSQAFAHCQVKKVFQAVCLRPPVDSTDRLQIDTITNSFKNSGYNLKRVFAETALYCKGD